MKKHKSSLEHAFSKEGVEYRIVDDGNCHTFHIFTIEKAKRANGCTMWYRVNGSPMTADWRTAHNALNLCAEQGM